MFGWWYRHNLVLPCHFKWFIWFNSQLTCDTFHIFFVLLSNTRPEITGSRSNCSWTYAPRSVLVYAISNIVIRIMLRMCIWVLNVTPLCMFFSGYNNGCPVNHWIIILYLTVQYFLSRCYFEKHKFGKIKDKYNDKNIYISEVFILYRMI